MNNYTYQHLAALCGLTEAQANIQGLAHSELLLQATKTAKN